MKKLFWNDYYEIPTIFSMLLIAIVVIFIIAIPTIKLYDHSCHKKAEMMNLECSYSFFTECMVKIDGQWQPFNDYNTINLKQ